MLPEDRCALYRETEYEFFWRPVPPKLVQLIAAQAPDCQRDLDTQHEWIGSSLTYAPAYALILLQSAQFMFPEQKFALVGFTHAQLSQIRS